MEPHRIVSREEWLAAHKAHLAEEKALTHARDVLAEKRRALPWVKVDTTYTFDTLQGRKTLADLFNGRSQLIVYHFMLGPDWRRGARAARSCPIISTARCSMLSSAMSRTSRCRVRRLRKSKRSKSAWVGIFAGCRRSAATSTTTIMFRSRLSSVKKVRCTTTSS